jgi:hypothetical protein
VFGLYRFCKCIFLRIDSLENNLMKELDDLKDEVTANRSIAASAVTLIQGLAAKLDAIASIGDPDQLKAELVSLTSSLRDSDQSIAVAIQANTPPTPADPPADPPSATGTDGSTTVDAS